MLPTVNWTVIPNTVPITRTFIQHSIWYDKESAEIALEQAKEEYNGEYLRAVVDTLQYDPWAKLLNELNLVYGKFVVLPADEEGKYDLPPYGDDGGIGEPRCNQSKDSLRTIQKKLLYNGKAVTVREIANEIRSATRIGTGKLENVTWNQLKSTASYKAEGSLLGMLNEDDFSNFKQLYNGGSLDATFSKELSVTLISGVLLVPTGDSIEFDNSMNLAGMSVDQSNSVLSYTSNWEYSYNDAASELASIFGENPIPENAWKAVTYPTTCNTVFYKEDAGNKFEIYESYEMKCGYPECSDMRSCGLTKFIANLPCEVGNSKFDAKAVFIRRNTRDLLNKIHDNLISDSQSITSTACDENGNISKIEEISQQTEKAMHDFANSNSDLLATIPRSTRCNLRRNFRIP